MKVWCYNCFGVCVARLEISQIEKWNETHKNFAYRITSWAE